MANTNLFIMGKGSKPGDTPTVGENPNAYYDTPTNPLVICTDTLTTDTTVACYEVRTGPNKPYYGATLNTGIYVDGTVSSNANITVDNGSGSNIDPRLHFNVGDDVYTNDGTILGTIQSMQYGSPTSAHWGITFTSAVSVSDNTQLKVTEGVSFAGNYTNILNRIYPNTSTSESYLENLENTPGYKISCAKFDITGIKREGESVASIDITNYDYFVMINADNPLNHHFAKITEITADDVTGDSFEFSPKYGSEISKGVKFSIYKGPAVADTSVVALSYGLYGNAVNYGTDSDETDGTGTADDSRHAGMTYISTPLFYFYNDRLNKKNELDHNTKYMLRYSRSDDGTETHYKRCFLTCQDYGLKAVDYGPYTMNATMVDMARERDQIYYFDPSTYSIAIDDTTPTNSYSVDVEDWNKCFINNKRHDGNLNFSKTSEFSSSTAAVNEGSFTGPTKYLHYDTSPELNNIVPEVIELNVFDSINDAGGYVDARIVDSKRIYGSKINEYDTIKVKKLIDTGSLSNDYVGLLPGKFTTAAGGSHIEVDLTNSAQDIRVLLGTVDTFEDIKVGDYIYSIASISAPVSHVQQIEILEGRLFSSPYFDATITTTQENLTEVSGYRKPWSNHMNNLIVDFTIDTTVNYSDPHTMSSIVYGNNTSTTGSASGSRLYNAEIILTSGQQTGLSFKIDYGDSNHNIITLQSPRLQLYRLETANDPNFLSYYNGRYSVYKTIFVGEVESLENYVEDGMLKYHLSGRNKINKLLGPIVNKNYKHTDDIIYSTYGPFIQASDAGTSQVNNANGYYLSTSSVTVSGGTLSANKLTFKDDGSIVGHISSGAGTTTISINNNTKTSLNDNDNLWQEHSNVNLLSFSKALEANPKLTQSPSSLLGSANKGLIFTSGKKLTTNSYFEPTTELSSLVGTSSNSHSSALGYHLNRPKGISESIDLPFMAHLKDEIESEDKIIHTVNSLTEYEVVDIDTGDGESIIELAPNCSVIMGRIDFNPEDTRFETLTDSGIKAGGSTSIGYNSDIQTENTTASNYANTNTALFDKYVYKSDGTLLGKVIGIHDDDTSNSCWIVFDRPLPAALSSGESFYTISDHKTQGLYLINTQGLRNGGILQLVNSELDSEYKPIAFQVKQTSDGTQTDDASNQHYCAVDRYGSYSWRYLDLQKGNKGAVNYLTRDINGDYVAYYSGISSQFNAYAPSFRFSPAFLTQPILHNFDTDNDFTNSYQKAGSHETRGIYPAMGSNFSDYTKYPSGSIPDDYLMPKKKHQTHGGPWGVDRLGNSVSSSSPVIGHKANAVTVAKNHLEIIDPKVIRTFLFSSADLYPDSMTRTNHIGNVERDFTDYNIMFKSNPSFIKSNVKHDKYKGELNQLQLTNDSYETLQISSSSIKTNQLRKLGIMRLTELTFDWHFNEIDPENISPKNQDNVNYFYYIRYQKLVTSGAQISGISGAVITCTGTVDTSRFADGDYIYDSSGNFLGVIKSSGISGSTIELTANVNQANGVDATGYLFYYPKGSSSNLNYYPYVLSGRDGEDTFTNLSEESSDHSQDTTDWTDWTNTPRPLNMLQMAIFNGYGAHDETNNDSAFDNPNTNNEGYGYSDNHAFKKSFIRKIGFTPDSRHDQAYLNHLILPPVFEGIVLKKLYEDSSATTHGSSTRLYAEHGSSTNITSGSTFTTNAINATDLTDQLSAGDRIYTDCGIFVGTVDSLAAPNITIEEDITNTIGKLTYNSSAATHTRGTLLCKGQKTFGSADIGAGPITSSGGTALDPKNLVATYAVGTAATIPTNEYVHPSRVIKSMADYLNNTNTLGITTKTLPNIYSNLRAVALTRHNIEGSGDNNNKRLTLGKGMSAVIGNSGDDPNVSMGVVTGANNQLTEKDYAGTFVGLRLEDGFSSFDTGTVASPDYRGQFAKWGDRTRADGAGILTKNRGKSDGSKCISDGGEFIFKPIFDTTGATITYTDSIGGRSNSLCRLRINPNTNANSSWLLHSPDLTGCYLVSTNAKDYEGITSRDVTDNHFTKPINNRIPKTIAYIISHEIVRTGSTVFHDFLIDNTTSGTIQTHYRIMRPNQICFYPKSPTEIDLYKMSHRYTKKADSDEMYDGIPLLRFQEDGHKFTSTGESDSGEGIQSMYVIVNPDHTSTESFLVPRGTNYDHDDKLFGTGKTFEEGSYDFLINDGIEKERKQITITKPSSGIYTKFNLGSNFNNIMSGVVSLGEVFSISTSTPVNLKNPTTASIGTSITIGDEAENIINDMLEENEIVYNNSSVTYPYFTAPNIQGADIFSSATFLAGFKNKEIIIDKDEIKLIANNATTRYTDIEINENDDGIKVVEIEQNKSGFDIYNEIIIYGKGVKSKKQNVHSIKKIGKKTLEEFHDSLNTQTEVDNKAKELLNFYNKNEKRVKVKLSNTNLEWVKSGDIIVIDYPSEHIPRGNYIILEVEHETSGLLTIQAGGYSKALDSRLAEMIMNNKKMASFLRSDRFGSSTINYSDFDSIKLKPIRIIGTKTTVSGHTALGLNTTLGFATLLRIGTRTTSEVLREDLI